jgi:hypothetical protein
MSLWLRVLLASLVACSREDARPQAHANPPPPAPSVSVVFIDPSHDRGANQDAPSYTVTPGPSLVIDTGMYTLPPPGNGAITLVHVAFPGGSFAAPWNGVGRVTLSASNLVADEGSAKFPGFEAGHEYVVGVGADVPRDGGKDFLVVWIGSVRAQGN